MAEEGQIPATVRIHVGGLGEKVTDEELRGIFGSKNFGRVDAVDIIRSKGRSFAYCDFVPSSSAALSNLLSTYNGCVWKGGRLRLEKAKEHFLVRLKREWDEDAALVTPPKEDSNADEVPETLKKPKNRFNPDGQIKLFFPRLRKVKPLPLKGTGKHKYSFQRVASLPYPKHFCDCEEHSAPYLPSREQQSSKPESFDDRVDAEEFDLMRSVMNKLFEKELGSHTAKDEQKLPEEEDAESMEVDEPQHEDSVQEESGEDEDGLVINIAGSSKNDRASLNKIENEISILKRQKTEHGGESSKQVIKVEKPNNLSPANRSLDAKSFGEGLLSNAAQQEKKPKDESEPRAKWSQKSSWKELLSDRAKSSFTVSDMFTGAASSNKVDMKIDDKKSDGQSEGTDSEESDENESDEQSEEESDEHDNEDSDGNESEESDELDSDDNDEEYDGPDLMDSEDHEFDRQSDEPDSVESEDDGSEPLSDAPDHVDGKDHEMDTRKISGEQTEESPEPKVSTEVHVNESYMNSGRGTSWLKRSSWTQLVAESQKESFSLSQMWSLGPKEETQDRQDDTAVTKDRHPEDEPSNALTFSKEETMTTPGTSLAKDPNNPILHKPVESNPESIHNHKHKGVAMARRAPLNIGEECLFMRSSASLRDWANAKAALTGSSKRKKS